MINFQVFCEEMVILSSLFNRPPMEKQALVRVHEILSAQLTTEEFRQASLEICATCDRFPSIPVFLEKVKGDPKLKAQEEWQKCLVAASRGLSRVDDLTEAGKAALRLIGGLHHIGQSTEDQVTWLRKEFISNWVAESSTSAPALTASFGGALNGR